MGNNPPLRGIDGINGRDIKDITYDPIFHQLNQSYSDGTTLKPVTIQTLVQGANGDQGKGVSNITYDTASQSVTLTGINTTPIPISTLYSNKINNNTLWCNGNTCTLPDKQNVNISKVIPASSVFNITSTIVGAPYSPDGKMNNNDSVQLTANSIITSNGNRIDVNGTQIQHGGVSMSKGFGPYQIKSDSGQCFDASKCTNGNCSGNCLNVNDPGIDNQLWYYNPSTNRLYNKGTNKCFSNNGSFTGGQWNVAPCDLSDRNQYWFKTQLNQFQTSNRQGGNCLDLNASGANAACGSDKNPAVPSAILKLYPINK